MASGRQAYRVALYAGDAAVDGKAEGQTSCMFIPAMAEGGSSHFLSFLSLQKRAVKPEPTGTHSWHTPMSKVGTGRNGAKRTPHARWGSPGAHAWRPCRTCGRASVSVSVSGASGHVNETAYDRCHGHAPMVSASATAFVGVPESLA